MQASTFGELGRLEEAIQPILSSLEAFVAQENWAQAAINAINLSELYLILGDLGQALNLAKRSVELADRKSDIFWRISTRATLATVLYHANRIGDSVVAFRKAEEMQKKMNRNSSFLYSTNGFWYCSLLLYQGKYKVVQVQASQTIKIAIQNNLTLDFALNKLSLGRAYLLMAQKDGSSDFLMAANHLNHAVDSLRQAGNQPYLPRGLLARAEFYRVSDDFDKAQHDLDEVMVIAERGSMVLHQVDCHLEYARLHIAKAEKGKARVSLDKAKQMIEKMGYHLRDNDVTEIEGQL